MAAGKKSAFNADEFVIERKNTQEVQEVQQVQEVYEVKPDVKFGETQGKKGHKSPRINMAFSPENHAWIKEQSRMNGMSITEFVNQILDRERMR